VIEWVPTPRLLVESEALPVPSSVPVPNWVVPSENTTEPLGMPLPDFGATRAVRVRFVPATAVELEAVSVVEVATATGTGFTVTLTAPEVLAANVESPP
jgi:hypothetical protein